MREFDEEARAELLCHLVVAQLVARAWTGEWLRADHLVETIRIWLAANGADCDWRERLTLAGLCLDLAPAFWRLEPLRDIVQLASLFTDGWRLDYRSPVVRGVARFTAAVHIEWSSEDLRQWYPIFHLRHP